MVTPKNINYLGVNFTKSIQDLSAENKALMKETQEELNR